MPEVIRIAIPTRNRPRLLSRVIGSIFEDVGRSGRHLELLIVDQSDHEIEKRNIEALKVAAKGSDAEVFHLGSEARRMITQIGPSEIVRLSETAPRDDRHGENRNWVTLFFAGYPYLSLDDDVIATGVMSKDLHGAEGARMDAQLPWSFLAYPTPADMLTATSPIPNLRSVAAEIIDCLSVAESDELFVAPGVVGHSGLASHVLLVDTSCDVSLRRMLASDQAFACAMQATSVVRQATRRRTDLMRSLVATAFAVKNCAPTVPFMPWGRGEDHVFCKALRASGKTPHVVSLDLSILHLPLHGRLPSSTIDVAGIASLATAAIESIGACDSSEHLAAELLRIARRKDRANSVVVALGDHAERQVQYCAQVAQMAAVCSVAFAAIEMLMLRWQALAQECRAGQLSNALANQLDEGMESIGQLALLGHSWSRMWAWFVRNQTAVKDACRIVTGRCDIVEMGARSISWRH